MKLVCIGDILITPEVMEKGTVGFDRYDEVKCMYFGPRNFDDFRVYQTKMEKMGYDCEPMPEEIMKEIEDADVVQVHMAPVGEAVFQRAKNLKILCSNRGGHENLNIEAATKYGVPVICNPAHNANAVAEFAVGLMLAENRNIARCSASMKHERYWREDFPNYGRIFEMQSKTVGIMGYGTIGTLVAKKLINGFGAKVIAYDPYVPAERMIAEGVTPVDKETLIRESDIITLHLRVTDETYHIIGREELEKMKDTAILINTARAKLVDIDALTEALQTRKIMGACLDVYEKEPLDPKSPLLDLDNIILTTHQGGVTVNAFEDSPAMLLEQIERFFNGEVPRFLKNPATLKNVGVS